MRGENKLKNPWILLILLIIGGLIGSLLGTAFGNFLPILNTDLNTIGLAPTTIDLLVVKITFGLLLDLNVASIVGFILAFLVYFKL